jgi:SAM-dependent methyltransferase
MASDDDTSMAGGWDSSAQAWIADMGEAGDYARAHVLDPPMAELVQAGRFTSALDVGCGEGRFCRMLRGWGIDATGMDPTDALLARARALDPGGAYLIGRAETLPFPDAAFDLVVSYLTLIDIPDVTAAIGEMARVLRPGGSLLIANLTSFNTAGPPTGWTREGGEPRFPIDHYLKERAQWVSWRGIRILNWHRPLETYMRLLLCQGLVLRHFSEPSPRGGDPERAVRYRRVPFFHIMEWVKPLNGGSPRQQAG